MKMRVVLNPCDNCQFPSHNSQPLCRAARLTDEIAHIILYGAHTIAFDHRQKYCEENEAKDFHQVEFITFVNRGLRHARMFAERAGRAIRHCCTESFALTLENYWIQRNIDGPVRKIKRKSIAAIAVAWTAWTRGLHETNLVWLSKPNPALGRMVADLIRGSILLDDELVEEYIPPDELDKIYVPQSIERRLQKKALEVQKGVDEIARENYTVNTHKENIVHFWVTEEFLDGELYPMLCDT